MSEDYEKGVGQNTMVLFASIGLTTVLGVSSFVLLGKGEPSFAVAYGGALLFGAYTLLLITYRLDGGQTHAN